MIDGAGRQGRMLALLAAEGPDIGRLCVACVDRLPGVAGVGVAVMTSVPTHRTVYASEGVGEKIEDLQFTLGEGPCVDAFAEGDLVLAPDLTRSQYVRRWPVFAPAAVTAGARAVFAFPLQVGAIRIGAFDLYRGAPGVLADTDVADALVFADALTLLLLLANGDSGGGRSADQLELAADRRAVVHQATGMVAVQLGVSVKDAFVLLRAYAFSQERPVEAVARDVVARELRLNEAN